MGWFPIGIVDAARAVALTVILFAGPLFEAAIVEGAWKDWIRLRGLWEVVGSWIGYRNMIAVSDFPAVLPSRLFHTLLLPF